MNRPLRQLVLPLLIVALVSPAFAQSAAARRVTLDLNGVAPPAAFKAVADAIGVSVTVDASVTEPVDIQVKNVTAGTALTAMCESIGCQWTISSGALSVKAASASPAGAYRVAGDKGADRAIVVGRAKPALAALKQTLPADMKFDHAPLDEVSRRLGEAIGLTVKLTSTDSEVKTLTADLGGLSLQEALKVMGEDAAGSKGAWRLTIGPLAGDTQTPTIAIMVGPKTVKKTVTKR
jgi:hypothetical protein